MSKNFRLFFLALIIHLSVVAQVIIPRQSYFHFIGTLGEDIQVTMDLVRLNDSLYGDYTYHFTSFKQNEYRKFYGSSQPLSGKMSVNNGFRLIEAFSKNGPVILGKFLNSNMISGTWETSKAKKYPFNLIEKYPEGSVQFNLFRDIAVKKLVNKPKSPQAKIELVLLLPGESSDILLSDSLRRIMERCFFGKNAPSAAPEIMITEMKDVFFENYINSNESIFKDNPDGACFNWELSKYMHILNNDQNLLTFYVISYAFTGGAHGLETHDFYSVDLKKGKTILLDDIVKPSSNSELSMLLTNKLKQLLGLSVEQKLTESGYFVDEVKPNDNFYVTNNGFGFFYNHYELAPYSFGFTDIFMTYDEVKSILK
jgi:hypothetical protein